MPYIPHGDFLRRVIGSWSLGWNIVSRQTSASSCGANQIPLKFKYRHKTKYIGGVDISRGSDKPKSPAAYLIPPYSIMRRVMMVQQINRLIQ